MNGSESALSPEGALRRGRSGTTAAWLGTIAVFAAGILLFAWLILLAAFGSTKEGLSYLRGEPIIVEPREIRLRSEAEPGVLAGKVSLRNLAARDARLIGVTSAGSSLACSCQLSLRGRSLPMVIGPHGRGEVDIVLLGADTASEIVEPIHILTDMPGQPFVPVLLRYPGSAGEGAAGPR